MSTVYITEPPTKGKVLLHTTAGDIDVELWPKEAPMACRNFCQLCMEGYYDGTIFHRIIRNFMIQGGDPTGTGEGGQSIWAEPFKDEFHQRLRFNHRGQVAMANPNKPNENGSQFFITLGECEWLEKKHTIFGKVTGNTIFNVTKMGDAETDSNDRPIYPPKITSVEVLSCPFDDIVPRTTRREREEAQRRAAAEAEAEARRARKRTAKKNTNLISFGEEAEEEEAGAAEAAVAFSGPKSSHDALDDPSLSKIVANTAHASVGSVRDSRSGEREAAGDGVDIEERPRGSALRTHERSVEKNDAGDDDEAVVEAAVAARQHAEGREARRKRKAQAKEYLKLKEGILKEKRAKMARESGGDTRNVLRTGRDAEHHAEIEADAKLMSAVEQRRAKYLKRNRATKGREGRTLDLLAKFQRKIRAAPSQGTADAAVDSSGGTTSADGGEYRGGIGANVTEMEQDAEDEDDNDMSWMGASLKFRRHIDDKYRSAGGHIDDYVSIDPKTADGQRTLADMSAARSNQRRAPARDHRRPDSRGDGAQQQSRDRRRPYDQRDRRGGFESHGRRDRGRRDR